MQLSKQAQQLYAKRLRESRLRILCNHGFFGYLLMHMNFSLDSKVKNVQANDKKLVFNPKFIDMLNNDELDLVMLHEITHISMRHNTKRKDFSNKRVFDRAADIVVNSNLLKSLDNNEQAITLLNEVLEHNYCNKEGYEYSVEQLYNHILSVDTDISDYQIDNSDDQSSSISGNESTDKLDGINSFDDHNNWDEELGDDLSDAKWQKYNNDACEMIYIKDPSNSRGLMPGYMARAFMQLKNPKVDWRELLNNFIQENICDYSFSPPDRRYSESDFFLPDFNDTEEVVKNILFMIDTSGSMSDDQITRAYSEVKGAIDQFGGKLQGWLGFFDAAIVEPKEFCEEKDFEIIKPYGGGGTSFDIIFAYARDFMKDKEVSSIVILTDGYAPFPNEKISNGIPTIWLINNEDITPPWGKVARIESDLNKRYA